jgi:molybdate transport system substrate-binding protein
MTGAGGRLSGISSMATQHVLAELAADYGRMAGTPVSVESVGGVDAARRVEAGEPFDFVVLALDAIERLGASGRLQDGSRVDVAASGVAIAVAADAIAPDVSTEFAVRDAVMKARSIGFSTGPSGAHLMRIFQRWGIAEELKSRLVQAAPGVPVGKLIVNGAVELGFQQLSELIHLPGIRVVGPLPDAIQIITTFSAAVCSATQRPDAARAWLSFLQSPSATAAKTRNGMQPA